MGNDYLSSLGQDFLKKLQLDKAKEAAKEKINNDGNLDFNETQELAGSVFSIGEDGTVSVEDSTINNLLSDLGVDKQSTDYDQLVEETRDELMTNVQDIVSQNEEQITTEEGLTEYDLIIENYGEYLKSIGVDIDDYSANDEDWSAISQIIADANPDLNVAWGEEIPAGTQINLPKIKIDENGKLVQAPDEETSSVNYDGEGIEGFENTTGLIDNGDGTYSVEVQEWGSDALDGNEYANDALSRIIANYYPDVEMYSEEYDKVLEEIMSRNEQITDPNLIHTGDKIELPVPEYDENGAITGFKTLEEVQGTTESQEAEETDETVQGTTESQDAEETDEITGEITTDGTEEDATNQGSVENADGEAQISDEVKEDLEALGLDPDKVEVVGDENITYYVQGNISITYDLGDFISKNYNDESGNTFATENYDSETNELTDRTILYNDGSFIVENYDENGNVTSKSYWMDNEQISSESFIYNEDGSVTHTITDANGEVTTEELSAEDVPPATEIPESFGPPPADAAATATATGTEIADEITSILADTKEGLEMLSGDNANKKLESSLQSIEDALSAINDMEDEDAKAEVLQNVISQLGKSGLTQITDIMDTVTKDHWIRRDERAGDDHKEIIEMLTTVDFNYPDNIKMLKEFYADRADNFWGKESFEENLYTIDENDIDTLGQMPVDTKRDLLESLFNDDLFSYHAGFDNEQKQLFKAIIMPNADYPQSFIDSKALIDEYRKSHNDTENMYMLSFHIADHQDILNNLSVEQMAEIIQLAGGGDTEEAIAKGKEWMEQYILDIYQYDGGEEMARESAAMFTLTEC